jgi:hypothetical protein
MMKIVHVEYTLSRCLGTEGLGFQGFFLNFGIFAYVYTHIYEIYANIIYMKYPGDRTWVSIWNSLMFYAHCTQSPKVILYSIVSTPEYTSLSFNHDPLHEVRYGIVHVCSHVSAYKGSDFGAFWI